MTDAIERMASIVREDPSITVKELARRMGFAEQKSVYYWLGKQRYRGLKDFKRAVLAQRYSAQVEDGRPGLPGTGVPEVQREGASRVMAVPVASSLSPDGREVAFSWNGEKQDNFDIYVQMVSGGTPQRLTSDSAPDSFPVWSPDANQIAPLSAIHGVESRQSGFHAVI